MKKTTVLIAEDHKLLREAWAALLNQHPHFMVVGEAVSGEEAVELAKQWQPDVILMDINLPGMNGIEATEQVLIHSPQSKVLGVSFHTQPAHIRSIMKKGAKGYITKTSSIEEMLEAIDEIGKGNRYFSKELQENLNEGTKEENSKKNKLHSLSSREMEVIELIKKGHTSKEIGKILGITEGTVEVHRYNILKKLELKNAAALIHFINKASLGFS